MMKRTHRGPAVGKPCAHNTLLLTCHCVELCRRTLALCAFCVWGTYTRFLAGTESVLLDPLFLLAMWRL